MNKFDLFKRTFFAISVGLFVGNLVYHLFDIDFSKSAALTQLVLKSFVTAVIVGLILGLFNMFFNIGNFQKVKK